MNDTIVALATPLGRSGIGVIRLSGADSLVILRKLIRDENFSPQPRKSSLKTVFAADSGEPIDETLITFFQFPHSFTGENVVEISSHGSPVVLRQILDLCLKFNARMANAGEFSLRALSNGRMNLSQAEAIRDLIEAQTVASARQSIKQLHGEFSKQLQPLKDELLDIIIVLESALEFVEDDLPDFQSESIRTKLLKVIENLNRIVSTFKAGKLIREGLKIALIGKPNVGKSSLFNALVGQDRAIVTEIAGTTRDQIHEKLTIENIPVSLIDTAGLRETSDTVESIGVERSRRAMFDADLIIALFDGSENITVEDRQIFTDVQELNHLIVFNKSDLASNAQKFTQDKFIEISAKTGAGLVQLQRAIIEPFKISEIEHSGFLVSDARHYDLLVRAESEVKNSLQLFNQSVSEEIVLIGLHNSLNFLGQITGETSTEDMLTRIFSTFCIGK